MVSLTESGMSAPKSPAHGLMSASNFSLNHSKMGSHSLTCSVFSSSLCWNTRLNDGVFAILSVATYFTTRHQRMDTKSHKYSFPRTHLLSEQESVCVQVLQRLVDRVPLGVVVWVVNHGVGQTSLWIRRTTPSELSTNNHLYSNSSLYYPTSPPTYQMHEAGNNFVFSGSPFLCHSQGKAVVRNL